MQLQFDIQKKETQRMLDGLIKKRGIDDFWGLVKIAEGRYQISGVYSESKRVKDAWRYVVFNVDDRLVYERNLGARGRFGDLDYSLPNEVSIVLVIESPHRDEYDLNFNPISPAQGDTGENIENHIEHLLERVSVSLKIKRMRFVISNPVQFQTSLFHVHKHSIKDEFIDLKNAVWNAIYLYEKDNFKDRVLLYNPVVVINACTVGFKRLVTGDLIECLEGSNVPIYEAKKHPSIWWKKSPRIEQVHPFGKR